MGILKKLTRMKTPIQFVFSSQSRKVAKLIYFKATD